MYNKQKREKNMENGKHNKTLVTIYTLFTEQSDESHPISISDIIAELETQGMVVKRRLIYRCMDVLKEIGLNIHHTRTGKGHAYYLEHSLSNSEALVLIEHISSSPAFSKNESHYLIEKIKSTLSIHQRNLLPDCYISSSKTDNNDFLKNIEILLPAISSCLFVEFQYYDLTFGKKRKYRKNKRIYHLTPYAIVSNNAKYYCVFYDHNHQSFTNYRLDKMDQVHITEEKDHPVPFSIDDYMRTNMNMYHGNASTITLQIDSSIENKVFEEFGEKNLILLKGSDENKKIISIKTTITPTLKSWLVLYYKQIKVIGPQSLIDELVTIANYFKEIYGEEYGTSK